MRHLVCALHIATLLVWSATGRASRPDDLDEPQTWADAPGGTVDDLQEPSPDGGSLWVGLSGALRTGQHATAFTVLGVLNVPLGRFGLPTPERRFGPQDPSQSSEASQPRAEAPADLALAPQTRPEARAELAPNDPLRRNPPSARPWAIAQTATPTATPKGATSDASTTRDAAPSPPAAPAAVVAGATPPPEALVVTPEATRRLVRAALVAQGLIDADARADHLASRARKSAALPELRLRGARSAEQTLRSNPTQTYPDRVAETGTADWVFEARMTWRLDRLVFADDEVALERLRHDTHELRSRLASRVVDLLVRWERARTTLLRSDVSEDELWAARLQLLEAETTLSVLTDGAFDRWRAAPIPSGSSGQTPPSSGRSGQDQPATRSSGRER